MRARTRKLRNVNSEEERNEEEEEEWPGTSAIPLIEQGYRPYRRVKGKRAYITLKRGREERSLGLYTPERWNKITALYEEHKPAEKPTPGVSPEVTLMKGLQGSTKGPGYLQEFKEMIRAQISKSSELTQFCFNVGLAVLLAALGRSKLNSQEYKRIALNQGSLKDALQRAAETAFTALESLDVDIVKKLENERDEARVMVTRLEIKLEKLLKAVHPKLFLERLIQTCLLCGNADPRLIHDLVQKWLSIKIAESLSESSS